MLKVLLVSYGFRCQLYSGFAAETDGVEISAVVEPNDFRRNLAKERFNIKEEMCFKSVDEAMAAGKIADCAINGTMDQFHYQTTMPLLEHGYHVLLEKPVTSDKTELLKLKETAEKNHVVLMICHLLRYTPFYSKIKKLIDDGEVGEIMTIEASENVGVIHASSAFIRGKWRNSKTDGSTLLMAKCCHDLDYLCWLNNATKPAYVSSFGSRNFLAPEKAPQDAPLRCMDGCPHQETCQWSAYRDYIKSTLFSYYAFETIDKPYDEITIEERIKSLKTDNVHGVCAYKTDKDMVDNQMLIIQFANGSTASLALMLGAMKPKRDIHIVGTAGEIEGTFEDSRIVLRKFEETNYCTEQVFDLSGEDGVNFGHMGGDGRLVDDFLKMVQGKKPSPAYTSIADSVNGHLCVYAADEARENMTVVKVDSI